jgi:hypothetical protein
MPRIINETIKVVNENSPIHDIVSEYKHENKLSCIDYVAHVMQCKLCLEAIQVMQARKAGSKKSEAKSRASRLNGLKGGRPKGK